MMAGFVYVVIGPTEFLVAFLISEITAWLSSIRKGDLHMVKKVFFEVIAYAKRIKGRAVASWEAHLPSRLSLLKSL
jgi:hypothetical protein